MNTRSTTRIEIDRMIDAFDNFIKQLKGEEMIRARISNHENCSKRIMVTLDTVDIKGNIDYGEIMFIHCDEIIWYKDMQRAEMKWDGHYLGSIPVKWLTLN